MANEPSIKWSEQLATGLDSIDRQHRHLVEIISRLEVLHGQGATVGEVADTLAELRQYTVYHFQHEAELMQAWPINKSHKAVHFKSHRGFVNRLEEAEKLIATNPADVVDHLLSFLVKWLIHHITGEDVRMVREIAALRSGTSVESAENPLHDALINTVSDLYDSLGQRTFEILSLNRQLQTYHDQQEEENALAQEIIMRLMSHVGLYHSQVHYWFSPTATFSGDIVAAMTGPQNKLYALMADATGHGLAAAITVLPVLTVFHSMAEQGHTVPAMVAEINRRLRNTLPPGRFVAAALLRIDPAGSTAEVWNGGMPELLLLGPDGGIAKKTPSHQLPLGIVDFDAGMSAAASIAWEAGSQFVMYSDGVTEATNPAGEMFGIGRLVKALQSVPAAQRIDAVRDAMASHLGEAAAHDDISLMLVDCV